MRNQGCSDNLMKCAFGLGNPCDLGGNTSLPTLLFTSLIYLWLIYFLKIIEV